MSTDATTGTMADEKGMGTGTRSNRMRTMPVSVVLRFLTFAATLSAFVIMVTDKQSVSIPVGVSPLGIVYGTAKAKYNYSDAFIWFVVANAIGFAYALLTLLIATWASSPRITRIIVFLDLIVSYIILSGASAATAVAYLGNVGLKQTRWNEICSTFHRFCDHVFGALVVSFLGWLFLTLAMIVTFHIRH